MCLHDGSLFGSQLLFIIEETKREIKRIHIYVCRCNERPKPKTEGIYTSHIH
jgi:hypothetical protein